MKKFNITTCSYFQFCLIKKKPGEVEVFKNISRSEFSSARLNVSHGSNFQIIYFLLSSEWWPPISELSLDPAQKNMVVGVQVTFS